jgi:hypothetical protein
MSGRFYVVFALASLLVIGTIVTASDVASQQQNVPDVKQLTVVSKKIDQACEKTWKERSLVPNAPASALRVARRLSLALTGTVPSLEEIRALEKLPEEQRVDAHVERLLRSRRFADYFAERLSRAYVGVNEGPFLIFRRRRFVYWLSDAISDGVAYDEVVRQMVAGTGLWTDRPGTNFITAHQRDPVQLTARSMRAFLGMRLDCAQCHDHPFSHWKQSDFEGIAAFYAGIEQTITGIEDTDKPFKPTGRMMMMDADPPSAEPAVPFAQDLLPEGEVKRRRLASWITSPNNLAFGKAIANRVWTMMFGRSATLTGVDDIEGDERVEGVLEILGSDFSDNGHDLRRLIRIIARTRVFRMGSEGEAATLNAQSRFASFPRVLLRAEQIAGSLVQIGNLHTVDAESHFLWKLMRATNVGEFVRRYGDAGEDEMREQSGTIMQRLVLMNGRIARERTEANIFSAAGRIAKLSPDDETRIRTAFLLCLARKPSPKELSHFTALVEGRKGKNRDHAMEDVVWALVNTTEFSWNH